MKTGFSNYGLNFTHTTDITQHQQRARPHLEETATIRKIITIMMITFMANTSTNLTKAPQAFCLHVQLVLFLLSPSSPAVTLPSIMDRSTFSLFFNIFTLVYVFEHLMTRDSLGICQTFYTSKIPKKKTILPEKNA